MNLPRRNWVTLCTISGPFPSSYLFHVVPNHLWRKTGICLLRPPESSPTYRTRSYILLSLLLEETLERNSPLPQDESPCCDLFSGSIELFEKIKKHQKQLLGVKLSCQQVALFYCNRQSSTATLLSGGQENKDSPSKSMFSKYTF